jgi:hypothetical protein
MTLKTYLVFIWICYIYIYIKNSSLNKKLYINWNYEGTFVYGNMFVLEMLTLTSKGLCYVIFNDNFEFEPDLDILTDKASNYLSL